VSRRRVLLLAAVDLVLVGALVGLAVLFLTVTS
jgi:hypothetical protein